MIEVESLTYSYAGGQDTPAVRDVSFAIPDGEIFGLLGPSGAGKSTTQKILIRLLTGYQGRISVMGKDLTRWSSDYFERVGVSFELPNHYLKLTALENLRYFRALYAGPTQSPEELLARVGLDEDAGRPVAQFSKGMRMRLNLARALVNRPDLLFLDEPTTGLDPALSRRVREIVREERARGATVFLTTHDMLVADTLCDRVGFMVDGRIATLDAPEALKQAHGNRNVRVTWHEEGTEQAAEFPLDGLGDNEAFRTLLSSQTIETIHSQEPTLEDIFITVTGQALT